MANSVLHVRPQDSELLAAIQSRQQQPGLMDMLGSGLGEGLGQGLGEGVSTGIKNAMQQSALQKALSMVNPKSSVLEQVTQLVGGTRDPAARDWILQNYLPLLQKQEENQAFAQSMGYGIPSEANQIAGQTTEQLPQEQQMPGTKTQQQPISGRKPISPNVMKMSKEQRDIYFQEREAEQKYSQKEKELSLKETKDYRDSVRKAYKTYQPTKQRLERMNELSESGKLDAPATAKLLGTFGFDWMLNPESQEYQKHIQEFLTGIKDTLGSQVSLGEVQIFLQGVPKLINSPEGRKLITRNLMIANEAKKVHYDAYKEIMKENNNIPPIDIEEQVNDRVQPELERLGKQFVKGLESEKVQVKLPDGKTGFIPRENLMKAQRMGAVAINE